MMKISVYLYICAPCYHPNGWMDFTYLYFTFQDFIHHSSYISVWWIWAFQLQKQKLFSGTPKEKIVIVLKWLQLFKETIFLNKTAKVYLQENSGTPARGPNIKCQYFSQKQLKWFWILNFLEIFTSGQCKTDPPSIKERVRAMFIWNCNILKLIPDSSLHFSHRHHILNQCITFTCPFDTRISKWCYIVLILKASLNIPPPKGIIQLTECSTQQQEPKIMRDRHIKHKIALWKLFKRFMGSTLQRYCKMYKPLACQPYRNSEHVLV